MEKVMREVYSAYDGKIFLTSQECLNYERTLKDFKVCDRCRGEKQINKQWHALGGADFTNGEGYWEGDQCPKCKGKGYLTYIPEKVIPGHWG